MFIFGGPEALAQAAWDAQWAKARAAGVPDVHYTEMNMSDLKKAFAYCYGATKDMFSADEEGGAYDIMKAEYDEMFEYVASISEELRMAVLQRRHQIMGRKTKGNRDYYMNLAGLGSES